MSGHRLAVAAVLSALAPALVACGGSGGGGSASASTSAGGGGATATASTGTTVAVSGTTATVAGATVAIPGTTVGTGVTGAAGASALALTSPSDGGLSFEPATLSAKAGKVTIAYANPSSVPHGVAIGDTKGQVVTAGGVSTVTVTLKPGAYEYYCPVPGHREAGMKGTLTVTG
jgi:plastocyanin